MKEHSLESFQEITKKYLTFLCTEDAHPKQRLELKEIIQKTYLVCKAMERPLSEREKKYLEYFNLGKSNKEIASLMKVKAATIYEYKRRILEKTGFSKIGQVVRTTVLD